MTGQTATATASDGGSPFPRYRQTRAGTGPGPRQAAGAHAPGMLALLCGRYLLEGLAGAGGMGVLWRARDIRLGRIVAVKVLRPEFAGSAEFRDLLRWEGRLAGLLSHPGVVQVRDYDDGPAGDVPCLVMEYVAGPSLAAVLRAEGTLSPRRVLGLIVQAAEALGCVHAAGIVHCDIKPANLLAAAGQVKIADFGIAQAAGAAPMTRADLVLGTPAYLSPERMAGLPATPASDLYGLGVTAYECLTGRPPFQGSPPADGPPHRDRPLPPLPADVPGAVTELVAALTETDPRRRPGEALTVAEWARRVRDDPQVTQAAAGPVRAGVALIPAQPSRGNDSPAQGGSCPLRRPYTPALSRPLPVSPDAIADARGWP